MHNLRHFYYQNREKIWKIVLIIAFLLGTIYFLNGRVVQKANPDAYTSNRSNVNYSNEQNKTYISDKSAISGENVTDKEVETINNTISKFLEYCKNQQSEQAYSMLSEDCKQNQYNTIEEFENGYLKSKFDKDNVYEIENWIRNTYKVSISKDLLTTGNINDDKKEIEYITIIEENSQEKLNISGYIGKKDINEVATKDNVKITAISKEIYMDYEIYDFKIENLSDKTIKVDSFEKTGTMYIEDSQGNKYNAYAHEILEEELEIKSKHQFNISIKYANTYSDKKNIKNIVFENIILDYIGYKKTENVEDFNEICKLDINL